MLTRALIVASGMTRIGCAENNKTRQRVRSYMDQFHLLCTLSCIKVQPLPHTQPPKALHHSDQCDSLTPIGSCVHHAHTSSVAGSHIGRLTHWQAYTLVGLHTGRFTHWQAYTLVGLHTGRFTHWQAYTLTGSHWQAYTLAGLHTGRFTH